PSEQSLPQFEHLPKQRPFDLVSRRSFRSRLTQPSPHPAQFLPHPVHIEFHPRISDHLHASLPGTTRTVSTTRVFPKEAPLCHCQLSVNLSGRKAGYTQMKSTPPGYSWRGGE